MDVSRNKKRMWLQIKTWMWLEMKKTNEARNEKTNVVRNEKNEYADKRKLIKIKIIWENEIKNRFEILS